MHRSSIPTRETVPVDEFGTVPPAVPREFPSGPKRVKVTVTWPGVALQMETWRWSPSPGGTQVIGHKKQSEWGSSSTHGREKA